MATGKYIAISYATCVTAQVAFACYAIAMFTRRLMQQKRDPTAEEFMTARGTANKWKIGWSFFASAVGAWCITSPASFAVNTGIVGLAMYAFASGIPVLLISLLGPIIQRLHPEVCTLPDFIGKRYGPVARTLVVCISLFNMSIAMLAEYIVIGALFKDFVGSVDYPIVIIVGVLTMTYTAYGGTYISIITDQLQGILTSILIVVLVIYVAITFRPEGGLPKPVPNDPNGPLGWALGANPQGYSAIFSMPCSLIAATVFSEAMWQKVWASESRRSVIFGGSFGFVLIMLAVFIFGFFGWLAAWAGYVVYGVTNDNLYTIQIFASQQDKENPAASTQVRSWIGVITLILACTMNEGAIDSLQNGIAAVFTQHFFKGQHTIFPRMVLVLLNIPLIVVSLQGYPILSLFLISNMLTTCCFLLVALGLWQRAKPYITESGLVFGFCVAMLTCTAYGIGNNWDPSDPQLSIRRGAWYTWYGNWTYDWDYFLVAACFQLVGLIMWIVGAQLLKRLFGIEGPGISGLLRRLPGFDIITGSGFQRDLLGYRCMAPVARLLRHTPADQLPTTASYDYPAPALKDEAGSLKDALSVPPPPATVGAKEAGEGDGVKGEEDRVSSDGSSGNAVEAKGV